MYQNDYIIAFDENGQPYIAHAGWLDNAKNVVTNAAQQVANKAKGVGRGVRQNHKYILKVLENGKTRYFYKQEEVKAYYEAKKRGIKNAAEYAQNAVKDKASDVADAAKNVVNKATGATANKTAETAKKNADDASRWAKMTERVHKENVANFKQNPTEANLARAKQSGQAVTRANQNEKNARKEADKAQASADQHPVNKAKSAFDQAKKSADNAVANAKNNYERMKSEFKNKSQKTAQAVVDATINKAAYEAPRAAAKVKEAASNLADTAKRKAGITAKEEVAEIEKAISQAKRDSAKTEQVRREIAKSAPDTRQAADADLAAERARNEIINKERDLKAAKSRYEDTPLGKVQSMIDTARKNARSEIDARRYDKVLDKAGQAYDVLEQARDKANAAKRKADDTHTPEDIAEYKRLDKEARAASRDYQKALNEAERVTESASKGTAAKLEEAQRTYINDKTSKDYQERVEAQARAQKQYSDFFEGLRDKYGIDRYWFRGDEVSEHDLENLHALEKKLDEANNALYGTRRAYEDALDEYNSSPLGKAEKKKKK